MIDLSQIPSSTTPIERPKVAKLIVKGLLALKAEGIETDLTYDFNELKEIFESTTGYTKINPMFDPAYSDLGPHNAFALMFRDINGKLVGFHAGRVQQCYSESVAEAMRSGKLFCDTPPNDWRCDVDAPGAEAMYGLVAWPGSLFLYPDFRKRGLTEKIVPLTFAMLRMIHGPATIISILEPDIAIKLGYQKYGLQRFEAIVKMTLWGRQVSMFFTYKTADEHGRDLFVEKYASGFGKAHLPH